MPASGPVYVKGLKTLRLMWARRTTLCRDGDIFKKKKSE